MKEVLKGFIVGIANIIPGVSGGTILVTTGLYEKVLDSIKKPISNSMFILKVGLGAVMGIFSLASTISWLFVNFYVITMFLFIGLIIGGMHSFYKTEISKVRLFYLLIGLSSLLINYIVGFDLPVTVISLFIVGIITGASMIVPGISGSLLLLLFGMYMPIMSFIKELSFQNIEYAYNLGVFGVGVLLGIFISAVLISRIIKTHRTQMMNIVFGLLIGSVIIIFPTSDYEWLSLLSIPAFVLGYFIAKKI